MGLVLATRLQKRRGSQRFTAHLHPSEISYSGLILDWDQIAQRTPNRRMRNRSSTPAAKRSKRNRSRSKSGGPALAGKVGTVANRGSEKARSFGAASSRADIGPLSKSLRSADQARFVALLKEVRLKAGLTQVDVAVRLDKPQSFVAKYEGSERRLDVMEFIVVARALEADPITLMRSLMRTKG